MKKLFVPVLAVFMMLGICSAHQPRIEFDQSHPETNPVVVSNPEISQAFYGDLQGQPDYYQITSDTGFLLYANIVVPDLSGSRTDFIVELFNGSSLLTRLDGTQVQWSGFYEPFAGDQYLRGPAREQQVSSGTYTIIVSNPGNQGKYSLAIGKIESFNLKETIHTFKVLPQLKTQFFNKPAWTIVDNKIGLFLGIGLLVLVGVIFIIVRGIKMLTKG
ncbi:MAG: hypothetical protein WC875_05215 [Candidatus Absconditabacterales bacterium]